MRRALYYPHTEIRETAEGERLLKRALLLWDKLEYIAPDDAYQPYYRDRRFSEAMEIIGLRHVPNNQERRIVHEEVEELVTRPVIPDAFYYHGQPEPYEIYPQKFSDATWTLLQKSRMAGEILPGTGDYPLAPQAGLVMMAVLADVCAGETCSRVTDRVQSYATLTALLADDSPTQIAEQQAREQVVTTTLELMNLDNLPLQKLVEFRRREEKESSVRALRHNYLERVEEHLAEFRANPALTESDRERKQEEFRDDMKDDIKDISAALGMEFKDAVFSKDILVTLAVGASALAATAFGAPFILSGVLTATSVPATVTGILGARNKYQKARTKIMQEHPMAYLYEMQPGLRL